MNLEKSPFYNPLDHSQIEFIPSHFDVATESLIPTDTDYSSTTDSHGSLTDNNVALRRGSFTISDIISNNASRIRSRDSSFDDAYHLARVSTTESLSSSVLDRIRYKIVLKLNPKEKQLVRESWELILNEDSISKPTKPKQHSNKTFHISNLVPINSNVSSGKNSESDNSVVSATHVSEPKGSATSKSFASSLFCSQFYANLLSMAPELERLYPSIKHQATAFAGVLNTAISNLENLQVLESYLICLGKRHARILDIEPPHFELMGVAFLKTLQDRFGTFCTIELEEVWSRLYSYLANSILQFGIDPVLQVNLEDDELIFPVPNLVEGSNITISRLNTLDSHDGTKSLRSMFTGRSHTVQSQAPSQAPSLMSSKLDAASYDDHINSSMNGQKRVQNSVTLPARGPPKLASNTTTRKPPPARHSNRTKPHDSKGKHRKVTSKLNLTSNEECSIM